MFLLSGHRLAVADVQWAPRHHYLYAQTCDGQVYVWLLHINKPAELLRRVSQLDAPLVLEALEAPPTSMPQVGVRTAHLSEPEGVSAALCRAAFRAAVPACVFVLSCSVRGDGLCGWFLSTRMASWPRTTLMNISLLVPEAGVADPQGVVLVWLGVRAAAVCCRKGWRTTLKASRRFLSPSRV